jgi:N-acetylglucosaminyl-diphospho-decaprenol L-rhamnosyltransferase
MVDQPSISILIVCYKSKGYISELLDSLFEHSDRSQIEVLLTDCSQDGTIEWIRDRYPQVRAIPTDSNLGFAAGNNFLAQHAHGTYLLLLNPDTILRDDAISALATTAAARPGGGAWGGLTILPSGAVDPSSTQTEPTLLRLALGAIGLASWTRGGVAIDGTEAKEVEVVTGAYMLVKRSVWESFEGFDTSFFMYAEELDLCTRLRRAGMSIWMTPTSRVIHNVGSGSAVNPNRIRSIHRAKMHFLRKHHGKAYAVVGGLLLWLTAANRSLAGWLMGMIGRNPKYRRAMEANRSVALQPNSWWHGYRSGASAAS